MSGVTGALSARRTFMDHDTVAQLLRDRDPGRSLPQPFYNDSALFGIEMDTLFAREWLFAGLTCEIPTRGSYFTFNVGTNPVLVIRDQNGGVRAFHNVCRHRGSRLCTQERGKVAKLVCPYHNWTYEVDGRLLFANTGPDTQFDLSALSLKPVHVRTAGGYIFVSLAAEPPEIDDFLSDLSEYLAPYDLDNARVAAESNIVEQANWKLVIENNRECYHCAGSHPELLRTLQEWDDVNDPRAPEGFREQMERKAAQWDAEGIPYQRVAHGLQNRMVRMPLLEGRHSMTLDGKPAVGRLMGRIRSPDLGSLRILHLPNSWSHAMADHLVAFRVLPLGAQQTLVTTKWLVHGEAKEGVDYDVENLRRVWDATNGQDRQLAEENQRGINSIAYEPGPYSPTYEFAVMNFLDWYGERMRWQLEGEVPELNVVCGAEK